MLYCTKCGKEIEPGSAFCTACGAPAAFVPKNSFEPPLQAVPARQGIFVTHIMGFIPMAAFFLFTIFLSFIMAAAAPVFFTMQNLSNVVMVSAIFVAIAMATVVSSRAKGPDLSIGPAIALACVIGAACSQQDLGVTGFIAAALACIIAGVINGVITVFCKVPAIINTLLTGLTLRYIAIWLTDGTSIPMKNPRDTIFGAGLVSAVILILIVFAIAFLFIFFTVLGKPRGKRNEKAVSTKLTYVAAYAVSGLIACIAGFYMLGRLGMAAPAIGGGYEVNIFFVYFAVISSRALDNRIGSVIYALVPVYILAMISNILIILNASAVEQQIVSAGMALILGIFAFIAHRSGRTEESI